MAKWPALVVMLVATVSINVLVVTVAVRSQLPVVVVPPPVPSPDDSLWSIPTDPPVVAVEPRVARSLPTPLRTNGRKPFYLVTSPESNGNRFVVALLMAGGCFGRSGHQQPFDVPINQAKGSWANKLKPPAQWGPNYDVAPCYVMHRSVPHARMWPNIAQLIGQIDAFGYEPRILVSWRPEDVARSSQVSQKHVPSQADAQRNILRAQRHIVDAIASLPDVWFRWVLYEELRHQHYVDWLFGEQMGIVLPESRPRFEDRDSKHIH